MSRTSTMVAWLLLFPLIAGCGTPRDVAAGSPPKDMIVTVEPSFPKEALEAGAVRYEVHPGDRATLHVEIVREDGTKEDITLSGDVIYKSVSPEVATVSKRGEVVFSPPDREVHVAPVFVVYRELSEFVTFVIRTPRDKK